MGKYEYIDFSKKLKRNFFIEYIKHSPEYKDVLNRMIALNCSDNIELWIKRDNYSLIVNLFNFDSSTQSFSLIQFVLFISLNLFCENKNIYLPDLEFPIVIMESKCNNKICKNLKIYGKVAANNKIFNDFCFDTVSSFGYFFQLEDDIENFEFLNLCDNLKNLNKMHYLNMFFDSRINYLKNVYISPDSISKELSLIKSNNIKVNTIDLRITSWFVYTTGEDILKCLNGINTKVNNCYLSIVGSNSLISSLEEYEEGCIKIINNLINFTCFKALNVTFIPSISNVKEKEQLYILKDKFLSMSTEILSIDVYIE